MVRIVATDAAFNRSAVDLPQALAAEQDLAALDEAAPARELDLEPAAAVDPDRLPRLAVHDDGAAARKSRGARPAWIASRPAARQRS